MRMSPRPLLCAKTRRDFLTNISDRWKSSIRRKWASWQRPLSVSPWWLSIALSPLLHCTTGGPPKTYPYLTLKFAWIGFPFLYEGRQQNNTFFQRPPTQESDIIWGATNGSFLYICVFIMAILRVRVFRFFVFCLLTTKTVLDPLCQKHKTGPRSLFSGLNLPSLPLKGKQRAIQALRILIKASWWETIKVVSLWERSSHAPGTSAQTCPRRLTSAKKDVTKHRDRYWRKNPPNCQRSVIQLQRWTESYPCKKHNGAQQEKSNFS